MVVPCPAAVPSARQNIDPLEDVAPAGRMAVTDRGCQRVGSVVGLWHLRQMKHGLDHELHLRLFGAAIAHQSLLDLQRRIFVDNQPCLGARQNSHASGLAHQNRSLGVAVEKQLLYRGLRGLIFFYDLCQPVVKADEPLRHLHRRLGSQRTVVDDRKSVAGHIDDSVAENRIARVDP